MDFPSLWIRSRSQAPAWERGEDGDQEARHAAHSETFLRHRALGSGSRLVDDRATTGAQEFLLVPAERDVANRQSPRIINSEKDSLRIRNAHSLYCCRRSVSSTDLRNLFSDGANSLSFLKTGCHERPSLIFKKYAYAASYVLSISPSRIASSILALILPITRPSFKSHTFMISSPRTGD